MKMNELKWVEHLKRRVAKSAGVIQGIGDDCALVSLGKEKLLLKSDLFVEDVHFPAAKRLATKRRSLAEGGRGLALPASGRRGGKQKITFKTIGMRAVSRVLSDFAACGGVPKFIGISLGMPSYVKERDLKEILAGVLALGKKYNFSLVGGDTSRAPKLIIDVWGVGQVDTFIARSGAKVGDYIFVTGKLGARAFNEPFTPRISEAQYLVKNFKINAMIDISDGFAIDLHRVLKESNKGALLNQDAIPTTKGISDFYRGEDYELIFTIDKSEAARAGLTKRFYCVGRIMAQKFGYMMEHDGTRSRIPVKGYTHF
ncbi:MAG: thiamine-phosphate kinase [Candidatus Omnitrophota bacterium]